MWIGIDDTDSRRGGCTTYLAGVLLSKIQKLGVHLIGFPRLVRLNPNVPWKTRGNGGVSFQIGIGGGSPDKIGRIHGSDVLSYPVMKKQIDDVVLIDKIKKVLLHEVESLAELSNDNTNPGLVITFNQFDESWYWNAVHRIIEKDEVVSFLKKQDAWFQEFKNGRGIIGATGSIAWTGDHDHTFELIAYRKRERWGSDRCIDEDSVIEMDKRCPTTFDNYDYVNHHVNIMPHSPCPVLFGIRGDKSQDLPECMNKITGESFDDWLIFASNQGTDDHLVNSSIDTLESFQSVIIEGTVSKKPVTIPGGHVIFSISDKGVSVDCAAYEPTKQFREVVRGLDRGDVITVFGGVRKQPFTVNLEKLEIKTCATVFEKIENPVCPVCGKHMKSKGRNQGFLCKKCKTTAGKAVVREKKRSVQKGLYEVPVCARRHLSKPLVRCNEKKC
jgi:tRNA(Ile2)-agmatinylcytidine synthase